MKEGRAPGENIKIGTVIILIGRMKAGKSPILKWLIELAGFKQNVILDKRGEFSDEYTLFRESKYFTRFFPKVRNAFVAMDEATGFVSRFSDEELEELVISCEHHNKVVAFCFHAVTDVPRFLAKKAAFSIKLPTNESYEEVASQRPRFKQFIGMTDDIFIDLNNFVPEN